MGNSWEAASSVGYTSGMSTLGEIEAAAEKLPPAEKQELLLFLAARLRALAGGLPPPRKFSADQVQAWIAEDEAEVQRVCDRK